jgi:hypothetical protein
LPPAFNLFWGEKNSGRKSGAVGWGRFGLLLRRVVKKTRIKFLPPAFNLFWGEKNSGRESGAAGRGGFSLLLRRV